MRNIGVVIKKMKEVLKKHDNIKSENYHNFKASLISLHDSISYAAPELLTTSWFFNKLGIIVNLYIKENDYNNNEWCKEIINIFINKNDL